MSLGYKTGAAMAADLKIAAHAVRQAVDKKPIVRDERGDLKNPRRARLVQISGEYATTHQLPDIEPRTRHALAVGDHVPAHGPWYSRATRDRNDNGMTRRKAA